MPTPRQLLDRLDARHDELIRKLDELNAQIEHALAQFGKSHSEASLPLGTLADVPAVAQPANRQAA